MTMTFTTMPATMSAIHWVALAAIALLLFGGKKLPELARGLARGIRIFRDELHGTTQDIQNAVENPPPQSPQISQAKPEAPLPEGQKKI